VRARSECKEAELKVIRISLSKEQERELQEIFKQTKDRDERDRVQAVLLVHRGRSRRQIVQDLQISDRTLRRWLHDYQERGPAALRPGKPPGAPPRIPEHLAAEIQDWVIRGPQSQGLGRVSWTHEELAKHLGRVHGISVKKSAMHSYCQRHDIRPCRPSYRYLKADPAKQAQSAEELGELKKGLKMAS